MALYQCNIFMEHCIRGLQPINLLSEGTQFSEPCTISCYLLRVSAVSAINPLNAELNPICHSLKLLGARHIFHVSR
jgi:hypothetical protein